MKSLKGKIISSAISIGAIVTLIAFGVSTSAWFSSNKTTTGNGITISSETDSEFTFTYVMYYYDNLKGEVVMKDEPEAKVDLSLQDFNTGISESTDTFNTILRVTIDFYKTYTSTKSFVSNYKNKSTEIGGTYTGGEGEATRTYIDQTGYKYNYEKSPTEKGQFICDFISNIIQFKQFIYSYTAKGVTYLPGKDRPFLVDTKKTIDNTDETTIYNSATSIFKDLENKLTFVNSSSKDGEIEQKFSGIPGDAESIDFFIEYNYSRPLLNNYIKNNEYLKNREFGDDFDITKLNLNVEFKKDLKSIIFSSESTGA